MNSMADLNGAGAVGIVFVDDRDFDVTVSGSNATTNVTATEDQEHSLTFGPQLNIIAADNTTSNNITLTLDFTNASEPSVTWPSQTRNELYSTPSAGTFQVTKLQTNTDLQYVINNTTIYLKDQKSNFSYTITASWPGGSVAQTFNVTITTVTDLSNVGVDRNYTQNSFTSIFTSNTPQITDTNDQNYTLSFSVSNGRLKGPGSSYPYSNSYTFTTGNKATVNPLISSLEYIPVAGTIAQDTVSYTLTNSASNVIASGTFYLNGQVRSPGFGEQIYQNTTVDITEHMKLFCICDIWVIGGGGADGQDNDFSGGGGGAGGGIMFEDVDILGSIDRLIVTQVGSAGVGVDGNGDGNNGGDSILSVDVGGSVGQLIRAYGGGGGGAGGLAVNIPIRYEVVPGNAGKDGGCGGGGGACRPNTNDPGLEGSVAAAGGDITRTEWSESYLGPVGGIEIDYQYAGQTGGAQNINGIYYEDPGEGGGPGTTVGWLGSTIYGKGSPVNGNTNNGSAGQEGAVIFWIRAK